MKDNPQLQPPIARKEHKETALHGAVLTDDYAWLRDKDNPEVTAYLEAENAYAEAVMKPLDGLRDNLYQEMLSHVKQTDVSVPFRDGGWWYLTRTEEGLQYAIHCRKPGTAKESLGAPSFPLLSAVEGSEFFSAERVGDHEPEPAFARPKPAKSVPRKPTAAKKTAKKKSYSRRKKTVLP